MHELGIAQEIVALASDRSAGRRIRRIVVEVGVLSAVVHVGHEVHAEDDQIADDEEPHTGLSRNVVAHLCAWLVGGDASSGAVREFGHACARSRGSGDVNSLSSQAFSSSSSGCLLMAR